MYASVSENRIYLDQLWISLLSSFLPSPWIFLRFSLSRFISIKKSDRQPSWISADFNQTRESHLEKTRGKWCCCKSNNVRNFFYGWQKWVTPRERKKNVQYDFALVSKNTQVWSTELRISHVSTTGNDQQSMLFGCFDRISEWRIAINS